MRVLVEVDRAHAEFTRMLRVAVESAKTFRDRSEVRSSVHIRVPALGDELSEILQKKKTGRTDGRGGGRVRVEEALEEKEVVVSIAVVPAYGKGQRRARRILPRTYKYGMPLASHRWPLFLPTAPAITSKPARPSSP